MHNSDNVVRKWLYQLEKRAPAARPRAAPSRRRWGGAVRGGPPRFNRARGGRRRWRAVRFQGMGRRARACAYCPFACACDGPAGATISDDDTYRHQCGFIMLSSTLTELLSTHFHSEFQFRRVSSWGSLWSDGEAHPAERHLSHVCRQLLCIVHPAITAVSLSSVFPSLGSSQLSFIRNSVL